MRYLLRRLIESLITVVLILTVTFFLFRVIPGDPARILIRGPGITREVIEHYERLFGLDKPLIVQFGLFVRETFRGNLGVSFAYKTPVLELLFERMGNTLILLVPATLVSILLGLFLGVLAAWKRGRPLDFALQVISLGFWSIPTFWLGMILIMLLGRAFSTGGMITPGVEHSSLGAYLADLAKHMFLPALTLVLIMHGQYFMIMRSQLAEELTEPYTRTAKAKGLRTGRILRAHVVPNAMLPITTLIALNLATLVAGFITIETVFSWPGIGKLVYRAILMRDYPVLQGILIFLSLSIVVANFLADILYTVLDPRIRYR